MSQPLILATWLKHSSFVSLAEPGYGKLPAQYVYLLKHMILLGWRYKNLSIRLCFLSYRLLLLDSSSSVVRLFFICPSKSHHEVYLDCCSGSLSSCSQSMENVCLSIWSDCNVTEHASNNNGTISCHKLGTFCAGDSGKTNIIIHCQDKHNATNNYAGNCNDNLAGVCGGGMCPWAGLSWSNVI